MLRYDSHSPQKVAEKIYELDAQYGPITHFYEVSAVGEDARYAGAQAICRQGTRCARSGEYLAKLRAQKERIKIGRDAAIGAMVKLRKERGGRKVVSDPLCSSSV